MGKLKVLLLTLILVLFIMPSYLAAETGVTDKEVVIGVIEPLTGPAAGWGVPIAAGIQGWADYINENGGIHGRKIKIIAKDDGYNPARSVAGLQEMKNDIFAVVGQLGSAPCAAAKDFYPENKIPLVTAYGNVMIYAKQPKEKQKYYFQAYPNYEDETEYMTGYAINTLGVKTIAHFYQNDEYGLGANAGIKTALKKNPGKAKLIAEIPYEVGERSLGTHAIKLKESGAELVIMTAMLSSGAIMTKEMAKIAYRPKVMGNFPLGNDLMFKIAGPTWEGTYSFVSAHQGIPGFHPEADKIFDLVSKRRPKAKGNAVTALFGAASMMHMEKGLQNAGKDLTRESLIKGMEKIKNWTCPAGGAPITYGPDRHHGTNSVWPVVAKDGKHRPIGNYIEFKPKY
ncbi:ABC transporter substrate-binding protein [Thermodesulfobacteriota bacterium]